LQDGDHQDATNEPMVRKGRKRFHNILTRNGELWSQHGQEYTFFGTEDGNARHEFLMDISSGPACSSSGAFLQRG
jgi:hypothetical protein